MMDIDYEILMNSKKIDINSKKITNEQWNSELSKIRIKKENMNQLVANYLIIEGHKNALLKFIEEAKVKIEYDENLLDKRVKIRNLILEDNIQEAINEINNINSEILEKNPNIHFELKKQKLISLIKENKVDESLEFAQKVLYPITQNNQKMLSELEKIMSLLAFENISQSPFKDIGTKVNLKTLASIVNLTILSEQSQPCDLILPLVLKLLKFIQEAKINIEYDEELLDKRVKIRNLILEDKIQDAINEINNINSEILEKNPNIHFELKKQKLISLIQENKIDESLEFAQKVLYPITQNNQKMLSELEKIMSLLAFENISQSPFKDIGTKINLKTLASIVNLTILSEQSQSCDLILPLVLKLLKFSQKELKKEIEFPEVISICPFKFSKVETSSN